jgi:RNA polymerase sigma-70 factor (ECF subfamily)
MVADEELVEQTRQGKREAYGELFAKYYRQIYPICLSILKDPEDAEEISQEAFIHAYLKLDELQKPGSFFPWLKKIARNRSRDHMRRAMVRIAQPRAEDSQLYFAAPDEQLLRQELIDAIMEAIEVLPVQDRKIVQARIDGLSHREISERFGISIQSSLSRLYRARRTLSLQMRELLHLVFGLPGALSLKKVISGGIIAMKIGTGVKVTIGIIIVLAAGFAGFHIVTHEPDTELSEKSAQQRPARTEIEQETGAKVETISAKSDRIEEDQRELIDFLDQLDRSGQNEELEIDAEILKNDVTTSMTETANVKDQAGKSDIPGRTPEQQRKYEILAELLPQYHELGESLRIVDSQRLSMIANNYPPKGSEPERFHQYERDLINVTEEYQRIYDKQKAILLEIKEYFPEAVTIHDAGWSLDYRKLREAIGGRLPTDIKQ